MGHDYSYGALESVRSFLSEELLLEMDRALSMSETPERKRQGWDIKSQGDAWRAMDDGRSSMSCMVYTRGHWRILCNKRFEDTFASGAEIERNVEELRVLPSFYYGSTISSDDHDEFVQLLASTYLSGSGDDMGEHSAVLKCIDRHGASFLAMVSLKIVILGSGHNIGLRVSILPLPTSRYMQPQDMVAPVLGGERGAWGVGKKDPASFM